MSTTKSQKTLMTWKVLQRVVNLQELLNKIVKWIAIPCAIFLLLFLAVPSEAKALVQTSPQLLISDGIPIAYQVSEDTIAAVYKFEQAVNDLDPDGSLISDISPDQYNDGMVLVTVTNFWHYQPYQMRKQAAQGLWNIWATTYSPDNPDSARVKILDLRGNRVGGSSVWGGSLIDVDK